jgi:phosphoserine aminotransferase
MITFYPGPSKIYPQTATYLQEAIEAGILSVNHRSSMCMDLVADTMRLLKQKLHIPAHYYIYFTSSATECWEIVAQSIIGTDGQSLHLYNGAFGQKWHEYTQRLCPQAKAQSFGLNQSLVDTQLDQGAPIICLTPSETSNGTQVSMNDWKKLKNKHNNPNTLWCADVTSSMGGLTFDWALGDVWLASVQKCFGLPAGMGIMICSPKAIAHAMLVNDQKHYNSLLFIHENFAKYQTPYTPNVLGIFLLNKVLNQLSDITVVDGQIKQQAAEWYQFLEQSKLSLLVENKEVRSDTVIAISNTPEQIRQLKEYCLSQGVMVGNGYGSWKNTTVRLANFPAIEAHEIDALKRLFLNYQHISNLKIC